MPLGSQAGSKTRRQTRHRVALQWYRETAMHNVSLSLLCSMQLQMAVVKEQG
jgi:hypothetical protein